MCIIIVIIFIIIIRDVERNKQTGSGLGKGSLIYRACSFAAYVVLLRIFGSDGPGHDFLPSGILVAAAPGKAVGRSCGEVATRSGTFGLAFRQTVSGLGQIPLRQAVRESPER